MTFLNKAHDAGYVKSRYIRHVGYLLAMAIVEGHPLPWNTVREMENLRFTESTRPHEMILAAETFLPCIGNTGAQEDDVLSGSQYQVELSIDIGTTTLT